MSVHVCTKVLLKAIEISTNLVFFKPKFPNIIAKHALV